MSNKRIIGLVSIVFVAFVGYKFISSGIQESKEKAVLQEKYKLEQQAKEPLNQCLENIDAKLESFSRLMADTYKDINKPGEKEICERRNKSWALSQGTIYNPKSCSVTLAEVFSEIELKRQELEPEKQDCYKRYK